MDPGGRLRRSLNVLDNKRHKRVLTFFCAAQHGLKSDMMYFFWVSIDAIDECGDRLARAHLILELTPEGQMGCLQNRARQDPRDLQEFGVRGPI